MYSLASFLDHQFLSISLFTFMRTCTHSHREAREPKQVPEDVGLICKRYPDSKHRLLWYKQCNSKQCCYFAHMMIAWLQGIFTLATLQLFVVMISSLSMLHILVVALCWHLSRIQDRSSTWLGFWGEVWQNNYAVSATDHMVRFLRSSPYVFAYCKQAIKYGRCRKPDNEASIPLAKHLAVSPCSWSPACT